MRCVLALVITLAGCGRWGFAQPLDASAGDEGTDAVAEIALDADTDAEAPKPDAAPMADAAPMPDSPAGMGMYSVAATTVPYTPLAGGTAVPGFVVPADDDSYALALPFTFTFYGIMYSSVNISANGYVTFEAPVTGAEAMMNDCPLDGTAPGATIAVFWDDLYASAAVMPFGTLTYAVTGTAPNRRLTIEWRDFDAFYLAGSGNNAFTQGVRITQSLALREDNVIEMHYGPRTPPSAASKDCGADRHRGCSATVGLEASGSTLFTPVQCGTALGPGPGYAPIDEGKHLVFTPS
ncbi:MAG: hypothetical protein H0T46_07165 [Deltaproteobacteria bacterium]|nr:hypothetical protein [Deltaproteobacteria bacterium]